jgi:DNA polymerase V
MDKVLILSCLEKINIQIQRIITLKKGYKLIYKILNYLVNIANKFSFMSFIDRDPGEGIATQQINKNYQSGQIIQANATGFGAASDDFMERGIDLNEQLIRNKPATFFFRVNSDAMLGAGIHIGDILIVDRSLPASSGKVVVAVLNGEFLVRRLQIQENSISLVPENKRYGIIQVAQLEQYSTWGIVSFVIHSL